MTVREYIGARYVPIFIGEWTNTVTYEPLSIVSHEGDTYTSRQYVPLGIDIDNEVYWAHTGDFNAQVEQYRQEVLALSAALPDTDFDSTNTVAKAIQETYTKNPVYNVKDYGAKGDGETDDTNAFKAAINAAGQNHGHVYVPVNDGECYIITDTLNVTGNFIDIYSNAYPSLSWQYAGIHFTPQSANDVLFNITGSGCTLNNLIMVSDTAYDGTAIYAKMTGAPDTDVAIESCYFAHWNLGVDFYDRGLKCCDNTFAIMKYAIKIGMSQDLTNTGTDTQRGIVIERNRIHVSELAIEVVDAQPQGMFVCDNLMDVSYSSVNDGNKLLYGNANTVFRSLMIQNNIVLSSRNWVIDIEGTANGCTISGNNFNNIVAANPEGLIKIATVTNCNIVENFLSATSKNTIHFGTVNGLNLSNNMFASVAQASDTSVHYAAVFILTSIQSAIICNNFFALNSSANARCIRYDGTAEVSYTRITNNMSRRSEIFTNTNSATVSNSIIQATNLD